MISFLLILILSNVSVSQPKGQPNFQGTWTIATLTPLVRDPKLGNLKEYSVDDAAKVEKENFEFIQNVNKDSPTSLKTKDLPLECIKGFTGAKCGYNEFWLELSNSLIEIDGKKRTSIIIEPFNGRIPFLKKWTPITDFGTDGPEDRPLAERCLTPYGLAGGPPLLPAIYNNNYQIIQNEDSIAILSEMIHDVRMIRIGSAPVQKRTRRWMGNSTASWVNESLVIKTDGFNEKQYFFGSVKNLKLTEVLTKVSENRIKYKFTVENEDVFSRPWTGELILNRTSDVIFEYACHEGNKTIASVLTSARRKEKKK